MKATADQAIHGLAGGGCDHGGPGGGELARGSLWCRRIRTDIAADPEGPGPTAPVKTLDEIIEGGKCHPTIECRLVTSREFQGPPEDGRGCREAEKNTEVLRRNVRAALARHHLDALVYPSWNNPPRLIGDLNTPLGSNSPLLSPPWGFSAITVPMGYVRGSLPVGLQIRGDAWPKGTLLETVYGYEQATQHRRPPDTTPPLERD